MMSSTKCEEVEENIELLQFFMPLSIDAGTEMRTKEITEWTYFSFFITYRENEYDQFISVYRLYNIAR
jgi:hypothetical protein